MISFLSKFEARTQKDPATIENMNMEDLKEYGSPSFQPEPLNDEWSKWLVGEWKIYGQTEWVAGDLEGLDTSEMEGLGGGTAKIDLDLNGQFLIINTEGEIPQMTDEEIQNLKETTQASDEEIERFKSAPFKSRQLYTIDPNTGEIIGYLFDSLRSIAEGRGRLEGNKLIMEWKWYSLGQGVSSKQIRERVGDDKLIITEEFTMPDGKVMKEITVMIRKKQRKAKSKRFNSIIM
jgi:hypothetical protein